MLVGRASSKQWRMADGALARLAARGKPPQGIGLFQLKRFQFFACIRDSASLRRGSGTANIWAGQSKQALHDRGLKDGDTITPLPRRDPFSLLSLNCKRKNAESAHRIFACLPVICHTAILLARDWPGVSVWSVS